MQPEARPEVLQFSKIVLSEELAHERTNISRPHSVPCQISTLKSAPVTTADLSVYKRRHESADIP